MHGQPPLWNVIGAILLKLFGSWQMQDLQLLHVGMGAAIAGLSVRIVAHSTGSRRLSIAVGLVIALHPALFLYEAYALYTLFAAFLLTSAAYTLTAAPSESNAGRALPFVGCMTALVMTRGVFHVALLIPCIALAFTGAARPRRRQLLVLGLLFALPLGWYTKNQVQHGFFGGSSWYGMGMWRTALFRQDTAILPPLLEAGVFEAVVLEEPFSPPSAYRGLGYDRSSSIAVLANNDQHNVNVPDISGAYRTSALGLMRRTPGRYVRNVVTAYGNFSAPSTDFAHLADNRERIGLHARIEQWSLGRPLLARIERGLNGAYFGSLYFFLFPVVLMAWTAEIVRGIRREGWSSLSADASVLFMGGIIAYTILVSCAMELGENVRFKFMIEPLFLILTATLSYRLLQRRRHLER